MKLRAERVVALVLSAFICCALLTGCGGSGRGNWETVRGSVSVVDGWLVLASGGPARGAEKQTWEYFTPSTLEVGAKSDGWEEDTSIGFERWFDLNHYGVYFKL